MRKRLLICRAVFFRGEDMQVLTNPKMGPAAAIFFLFAAAMAEAQFSSGVEGTVKDPTGAVVAGATVTLTNVGTANKRVGTTSAEGYFRFPSLPAAGYTLNVSAPGFETTEQPRFQLDVADIKTVNVTLHLGAANSVVVVNDTPPNVELTEARISGLVGEKEVQDLPMPGQNVSSLVLLTPGVTGLPSGGSQLYAQANADIFNAEFSLNLHASGLRTVSNKLLVDSGSVTSYVTRGVTNFNPNGESVQEMRVEVSNFSAEYAAAAGAVVNIETKQGANALHGSAAWYATNNDFTSRNVFQLTEPPFTRNEYSGSLGGPIWKNHTFAFGSFDVLRSNVSVGSVATIATTDFIDYMAQNYPNNTSTYLWKTYPAVVTPAFNFVTAGSLLGVDCSQQTTVSSPIGTLPCTLDVTGQNNFSATAPRNGLQFGLRFDHVFNHDADRFSGSVFRTTLSTIVGGSPSVYPAFDPLGPSSGIYSNVNYTHIVSPNLINEMGYTYNRPTGYNNCNHCDVPTINVVGMNGLGSGFGYGVYIQNNFEWRDVVSYNHGKHALKAGFSLEDGQSNTQFVPANSRPTYSFASVLDYAADSPYLQTGQTINPITGAVSQFSVNDRNHTYGIFAQDDWKIKPNLTLNIGLRWENLGNYHLQNGYTTNLVLGAGSDFTTRLANGKMESLGQVLPGDMDKNWAPRFGFAWDPMNKGKMSVRGGFGIFYDHVSSGLWGDFTANAPLVASVTGSIYTPPVLPVFGLGQSSSPPYGFPLPSNIVLGLNSQNGLNSGATTVGTTDMSLQPAYSENWFLGIQYALPGGWAVEIDDIGSSDHRQYINNDVNRFAGDLIVNQNVLTRINHSFGQMFYAQSIGTSFYSGGTIAVKNSNTHGLSTKISYSLTKSLDQNSGSTAAPYDIPDQTKVKSEWGLSDYDARQRLALNVVYSVPRPNIGSRFAKGLLGGWQVSDVTILQSGNPFSVYCSAPFAAVYKAAGPVADNTGCDYNADGFDYDVPETPSFGNTKRGLSRSDYLKGLFSASDFPAPPLGQEGNLGRNTFIGPGYADSDISAARTLALPWFHRGEKANLTLRAEFFNAFNRVNLTSPSGDMANPQFGKATSTFAARNIQFSGRFQF
jgi:hypothetical protein